MKIIKYFLISIIFLNAAVGTSQESDQGRKNDSIAKAKLLAQYENIKPAFDSAYKAFPDVPRGMLEAVSYHYTHFRHITNTTPESCAGLPFTYGVMGLTLDGKNYFRNNLLTVAGLSGISTDSIIESPMANVKAFACAFSSVKNQLNISSKRPEAMLKVLIALSELNISSETAINDYTMNLYLFGILSFLNNPVYQHEFGFPDYNIDLQKVFGAANLKIFTAPRVTVYNGSVSGTNGQMYAPTNILTTCPDYNFANCSWVASPNHYTGWNGHTVSAIAIHTVQGSYTSCVNYFQNSSASASTHYVVASNSSYAGQDTQMVDESNAAWHVTSENYYAIGYEHEGFVDDASWYTTTMYQTSADLTRDVCVGNNINPLRMFYRDTLDDGTAMDYGLHNLGAEGSCIKIKGHQHFPNQSHTDPGPNWCWDYYFKLVNDNPTVNTLTTSSGNFFDSGGATANYTDDERTIWTIQPTGASSVTLTFTSFALEADYDFLYIYDGPSIWAPLIGRYNTLSPASVTSSGGSLTIEFRSDCATNAAGWAANWTSIQPDTVLPTTTISTPNNWKTADFTASFTDTDNTGVEKAFYNVIDFDGSLWTANASHGFFVDNFDTLQTFWTDSAGTWNVTANELVQSDEVVSNSNIFAALNQNLSNRYMYHFTAKVEGTNTNRRFGFHLFCDSAGQTNRGNSYFVWFRVDLQTLEFFKVTNNAYTTASKVISNVITTPGVYYDFKITYDRITGTIAVWRNNAFMGSWTDPAPYSTNGNYISFRSGNSKLTVTDINVYRSRYPTALVTLNDSTKNIRYQNPDPLTPGAKIKSVVVDTNNNLSTIESQTLNIDWTLPDSVLVNDGPGADVDTTTLNTVLYANWSPSADTQSGIAKYWYAIGTAPDSTDVLNWTDNNLDTSVMVTGLSLITAHTYYFSVKAENGAGLYTRSASDGIFVNTSTNIDDAANTSNISAYINPVNNILKIDISAVDNNNVYMTLFDLVGRRVLKQNISELSADIDLNFLTEGVYILHISCDSFCYTKKLIKH